MNSYINLPSEVESRFKAGFFAIQQKAGSFNGVWSEMATEKTIIKDCKSNGGGIVSPERNML